MERNSAVKHAQLGSAGMGDLLGRGHQGGEELQSSACLGLGSAGMGESLGRGIPV